MTKGRDCICWKLLLECPKALWEVNSNEVKFVSDSNKTNKQLETVWNKMADGSNMKFVEEHKQM